MKNLLLIILFSSIALSQYPTLMTDLISWYPLNEGSGNAIDAHGSNDGTVTGATYGATGIVDDAYSFDGNDYVQIAETDFEFNLTDSFSISAWVKTSASPSSIVNKMDNGAPYIGWDMTIPSAGTAGKVTAMLGTTYNTDFIWVGGATDMLNNVLRHVVITYNGSEDAAGVEIYLDGSANTVYTIVFDTFEGGESILNNEPVQIGERGSGGEGMVGIIDDVGIWGKVLTPTEVGYLYNSGSGLGYPFHEGNPPFMGINF